MDNLYRLLLGSLCVWRITHLLQAEDGPGDAIIRIRRAAGEGFLGTVLDCFYCLSLWVAFPIAWLIGHGLIDRAMLWLAFSGAACLLERRSTDSLTTSLSTRQAEHHE